ncbi:MAG: hypothetical protein IJD59_10725, partial [Clostridia bacterium]|nr:hypothetical protein [Clostridia bacterium]
ATPLRQANCSALCAGVRAERVGFAVCNFHTHQRSNRRFANFFFATFFFLGKKKVDRSPFVKGKYFLKNPVCLQRKNIFCYKIFEYEKSYLFHIR